MYTPDLKLKSRARKARQEEMKRITKLMLRCEKEIARKDLIKFGPENCHE